MAGVGGHRVELVFGVYGASADGAFVACVVVALVAHGCGGSRQVVGVCRNYKAVAAVMISAVRRACRFRDCGMEMC